MAGRPKPRSRAGGATRQAAATKRTAAKTAAPRRAKAAKASASGGIAAYLELADLLLQRAVVRMQATTRGKTDPLAGLKVDDADVGRLVAELTASGTVPVRTARALDALDTRIETARRRLHDRAASDAFAAIVESAQLDPVEVEVLAVCCAVELDPRRQQLVGYLNDDVTVRQCTPFTLRELFGAESGADLAVAPGRGLERAALAAHAEDRPWGSAPVVVARALMWWLAGERRPDPELPAGCEVLDTHPVPDGHDLVIVSGPDRIRRLQAAFGIVRGQGMLVTPLPANDQEWSAVIRHASLTGAAVVVEVDAELAPAARDRIERAPHVGWVVASREPLAIATLPRQTWIEVGAADALASIDEWEAFFGTAIAGSRLGAEQLQLLARAATGLGDLDAAAQRLAAGTIDRLAKRIRTTRSWNDIVLDDDRLELLRDVVARWQHRGTVYDDWGFSAEPSAGVVALFAGPSGTGKTLASEIIAGTLGYDLYKVDLSQLVSKYIGETEKHLARVFDAAEQADVVLLFDEADALLGKRSEVSDAHDRYANIEVAYLLQRLERYHGLVVMTTNLPKNIDEAFQRRVHVAIEFPMPGPKERQRIWELSLPEGAPVADVDLGWLARTFELAGGSIRNAALAAAFIAADAGEKITMDTLTVSVRRELRKMGRLLEEDDERFAALPRKASATRRRAGRLSYDATEVNPAPQA